MLIDTWIVGQKVRDRVTNFVGTATGYCVYISGCHQVCVQPPMNEKGEVPDGKWYDVQRLEVLPDAKLTLENETTPGFDAAPPVR